MSERRLARRIAAALALLAAAGVLGVVALLAALALERRTVVTLPTPTGPFAVGRVVQDWVDDAGVDSLAPVPGTRRELLVWIWYPSAAGPAAPADDYLPSWMRAAAARTAGPPTLPGRLMDLLTRDPSRVRAHAAHGPAVSPRQPAYPVVLLRAGASGSVTNYTTLAEDLASHGYLVVGPDAPYRTGLVVFPDGRVMGRTPANNPELAFGAPDSARRIDRLMAAWTGDMTFALDRLARLNASDPSGRFTGRLDLTRVGAFGHSFGGAQAAQFCHDDPRCRAGIDVDGAPVGSVVRAGIARPFMFLLGGHGDATDPESRRILADIRSIYDRLPRDGRLLVEIRGAGHFLFTDDVALRKSRILLGALRLFGVVGIDGRRQLAATAYCVHAFFDAYLKGTGGPPPAIPSPRFPELVARE
jgi:predicted dienelactone hydrolase